MVVPRAPETIRYGTGQAQAGDFLVALSPQGVCAISLGDNPKALVASLQQQFPFATLVDDAAGLATLIAQTRSLLDNPGSVYPLTLDIRGTDFQQQVWQALQRIPAGTRLTYTQLAEQLGNPKAVRAVAGACAANTLAVVIPCHRVVRSDGSLSGYRWGQSRKQWLLERESQ